MDSVGIHVIFSLKIPFETKLHRSKLGANRIVLLVGKSQLKHVGYHQRITAVYPSL